MQKTINITEVHFKRSNQTKKFIRFMFLNTQYYYFNSLNFDYI